MGLHHRRLGGHPALFLGRGIEGEGAAELHALGFEGCEELAVPATEAVPGLVALGAGLIGPLGALAGPVGRLGIRENPSPHLLAFVARRLEDLAVSAAPAMLDRFPPSRLAAALADDLARVAAVVGSGRRRRVLEPTARRLVARSGTNIGKGPAALILEACLQTDLGIRLVE
jgi:hypothetical protein